MNQPDYSTWNNTELIDLIDLPEHQHGLRYYLSKDQKVAMLNGCSQEQQDAYLAEAQRRQQEHHANLRSRRAAGPLDKGAAISAKLGDEVWRYVEQRRFPDGFRDACTNRKAKVACVIEGVRSGTRLAVTRDTVDRAHTQLRPVENWPPPRGRKPAKEASAAGLATGAVLRPD